MSAIKTAFASSILISDFIRADAGVAEAVFESRLAALYTAYYHVLKAGNKTQWNQVDAACKQFADVKACKEHMSVKAINAGVKRMHAVYLAYGAALAHVGVPSVMKGATPEAMDSAAAALASEFATMVTVALTPEAKPVKSAEEKAADKADKEAAQAAADKVAAEALADTVQAEAKKIADANAVTLADMVRTVASAIKQGLLSADDLQTIDTALDSVAANVTTVLVQADTEVPAHA